jgi:hypothetical protein
MLSTVAFVAQANPGTTPITPAAGTTITSMAIIVCQHAADLILFQEYHATDNVLKQQVISCVNSMYLYAHSVTASLASQMLQCIKC